ISSLIVSNCFVYSVVILVSNVNRRRQDYLFHGHTYPFTSVNVEFETVPRFTLVLRLPPSSLSYFVFLVHLDGAAINVFASSFFFFAGHRTISIVLPC
ncbi:unnamed protein product, partial [Brassica rapa subsp. trilocularis]